MLLVQGLYFENCVFLCLFVCFFCSVIWKWIAARWEIWGLIPKESCKKQLHLLFPPINLSSWRTTFPNGFKSWKERICTSCSPPGSILVFPGYRSAAKWTSCPKYGSYNICIFWASICSLEIGLNNQSFSALAASENNLGCFLKMCHVETSLPGGSGWGLGRNFFFFF